MPTLAHGCNQVEHSDKGVFFSCTMETPSQARIHRMVRIGRTDFSGRVVCLQFYVKVSLYMAYNSRAKWTKCKISRSFLHQFLSGLPDLAFICHNSDPLLLVLRMRIRREPIRYKTMIPLLHLCTFLPSMHVFSV